MSNPFHKCPLESVHPSGLVRTGKTRETGRTLSQLDDIDWVARTCPSHDKSRQKESDVNQPMKRKLSPVRNAAYAVTFVSEGSARGNSDFKAEDEKV
jgi:hypothetical protein